MASTFLGDAILRDGSADDVAKMLRRKRRQVNGSKQWSWAPPDSRGRLSPAQIVGAPARAVLVKVELRALNVRTGATLLGKSTSRQTQRGKLSSLETARTEMQFALQPQHPRASRCFNDLGIKVWEGYGWAYRTAELFNVNVCFCELSFFTYRIAGPPRLNLRKTGCEGSN